ncbi:amidohydrolase [Halorubellus sp. JP-L1]|uniref:amidohydrolase family protein n=1 Tax=Halorubellus sp. JP-L1 TaxID=2715753 RepID=UPI00140A8D89|nr:amidohydrolase family protein [Halorubellus sp. JP-L1]NHN42994.1 amidohydrolase [Halorubellus sp. JP-L1]
MAIDFGAHLFPLDTFPEPIDNGPVRDVIGPMLHDPDHLLETYAAAGISHAALSQPYYMGHEDADAVATANDALLDIVDAHEAFYGLAAIPVSAGGDAAAREFERALDAGYNGGALETKTNGVELTDDALEAVFDVAEARDAPILVHPKLHESLHPDALSDDWKLNAIFGREAALSESISKVIHEGVLDRHPDLDLVYHHLGGNIASMLGRIHIQLDDGRWPGQERVKPYDAFLEQLRDRIYLDSSGFFGYEAPLRNALDAVPASNVLFATDYPFEPRDDAELSSFVDTVETVAPDDADAVLHDNAERLLTNL